MKKIIIAILILSAIIFAQKAASWLFLGRTKVSALYLDIASVKQDGNNVSFSGKTESVVEFKADCKTKEFTVADSKPVVAPKGSFIELAIDTACGREQ